MGANEEEKIGTEIASDDGNSNESKKTVNTDTSDGGSAFSVEKTEARAYILGRLKRDPMTAPLCMKYVDLSKSEVHSDRYQTMIGIGDIPVSRTGFSAVY